VKTGRGRPKNARALPGPKRGLAGSRKCHLWTVVQMSRANTSKHLASAASSFRRCFRHAAAPCSQVRDLLDIDILIGGYTVLEVPHLY